MPSLLLYTLNLRTLVLALSLALLAGCGTHRIDVQQGNILEPESLDELRLGMTRQQVRFLLGNPAIVDTFHPNRWDYIYYTTKAGTDVPPRRLTLIFEDDVLREIIDQYRADDELV